MNRSKSSLTKRILIVLSLTLVVEAALALPSSKPNIVFLLADDMNRDTWGTYGSIDCKTPNIDKLAQEGMRFDRAYCSVAMCAPFRQELYSGRSPWRTGTLANHSKSKLNTKSIVHYLRPLGYRVALMGKSHIGPRSCYPFEFFKGSEDKTVDNNPLFIEQTRQFIDSCREEDTPFCLFIASHDSHGPLTTGDPSAYDAETLTIPPYWLDTPQIRKELVKYYAEITNFDSLVGSIRQELEKRDLWKDTIFCVCSEQGAHLPFAKWTCYDNGLHTGLVIHWQGVTKPGSVVEELISMADITPTLVDAAGGVLQAGDCDGKSFLKTLKGEKQKINHYVYGAFTNCNILDNRERIYPIRVVRDKAYTLIYNPNYRDITSNVTLSNALAMLHGNPPASRDVGTSWVELSRTVSHAKEVVYRLHHRPQFELYDRRKDPYELTNEIQNPEYQEVVERLKQWLFRRLDELGDPDPIETEKRLVKQK